MRQLENLFAEEDHLPVEVTWSVYQQVVAAYHNPDPSAGHQELQAVIDSIARRVPAGLAELARLGRSLAKRSADILAYFDLPHTSNGPTEAINGRLEHLRGTALDFRNLANYIRRALLDTGAFRPPFHSQIG